MRYTTRIRRRVGVSLVALGVLSSLFTAAPALGHGGGGKQFIEVIDLSDTTVTLPLREGVFNGDTVWFIITEASEGDEADEFGVSKVNKLENAADTGAVQSGWFDSDGILHFGGGAVDFTPDRVVDPPNFVAGAVGDPGYSPLVQLPNGTVLNAPHLANSRSSEQHDSLAESIDEGDTDVTISLVDGFARDKPVKYISTEASVEFAAALEASTFAPNLNAAPFVGGDGTDSARASLGLILNGQEGAGNRERQGLNSALAGEGDPLNLLAWTPNQGRYSPLWDVHPSEWADPTDAFRIREFAEIEDLAEDGDITGPDGATWGPGDFIVNCPIISQVRGEPA